jgi:cytosine/adenosine deaminase-related metal-dependent hydrolase
MPQVAVQGLHTAKTIKVHALPRGSHAVPKPAEAWWVLTRGGAEALGLGDRVGAVEVGMEADCLVVRPEKWIAELSPEQRISANTSILPGVVSGRGRSCKKRKRIGAESVFTSRAGRSIGMSRVRKRRRKAMVYSRSV